MLVHVVLIRLTKNHRADVDDNTCSLGHSLDRTKASKYLRRRILYPRLPERYEYYNTWATRLMNAEPCVSPAPAPVQAFPNGRHFRSICPWPSIQRRYQATINHMTQFQVNRTTIGIPPTFWDDCAKESKHRVAWWIFQSSHPFLPKYVGIVSVYCVNYQLELMSGSLHTLQRSAFGQVQNATRIKRTVMRRDLMAPSNNLFQYIFSCRWTITFTYQINNILEQGLGRHHFRWTGWSSSHSGTGAQRHARANGPW